VRKAILLFSIMLVILALGSGVALADVFTGTDGPDTYWGPVDNDSITGLGGNDFLVGDPTPYGAGGDDNVSEGPPFDASTDVVFGGAGDDLIDAFNEPPFMDIVDCGPGDDLVYADGLDNLVGCEEVILGPEPDPWDQIHNN
jgi:Ca2+-binding RTX toxin-like protein